MRARVYIDGFNLYYRRLKRSRTKWINLKQLSAEVLDDEDTIEAIKYFTADVSKRAGDEEAPARQEMFFRALKTIPELSIHKGSFLSKEKTRPLANNPDRYVSVLDTEEKGSDVNLASHLLMDAFCDAFDVALVFSQDTDLITPLRMVREDLGKIVIVAWMDRTSPGKKFRSVASSIRHVHDGMLQRSTFPEVVIGRGGAKLVRPREWDFDEKHE